MSDLEHHTMNGSSTTPASGFRGSPEAGSSASAQLVPIAHIGVDIPAAVISVEIFAENYRHEHVRFLIKYNLDTILFKAKTL